MQLVHPIELEREHIGQHGRQHRYGVGARDQQCIVGRRRVFEARERGDMFPRVAYVDVVHAERGAARGHDEPIGAGIRFVQIHRCERGSDQLSHRGCIIGIERYGSAR